MYSFIIVSGVDALTFLQGQFTQDLARLTPGKCLPAAWCNAQGRVLMTLRLVRFGDEFALTVVDDIAATAMGRLQMYRLRSKVELSAGGQEWQLFATPGHRDPAAAEREGEWHQSIPAEPPVTETVTRRDPSAAKPSANSRVLDTNAWRAARVRAGQVDISAANSALYTPHMLNLDRCGAISFEKGCYTGQEIVARTEHLGRSKRRMLRFRCDAPDLAVGDAIQDGESDLGVVVNAAGNECLAVVPVDVANRTLDIRGIPAIPQLLPYAVI